MPKTILLSTAASFTAGLLIGAAGMAFSKREAGTTPSPSNTPMAATGQQNSYEATVTKVIADNVIHVRAHTWVAQYAMESICLRGAVTVPKPCNYEADFNASSAKKGAVITLANLSPVTEPQGPHTVTRDIPNIRPRQDVLKGPIPARVVKLVDGDTVQVVAESFPGHVVITDIRIGDIDTPEKKGRAKCDAEAALAERASTETSRLIEGKTVTLHNVQFEKYGGRVLGDIMSADGTSAAQNLIAKGLAKPYDGGTKMNWCKK